MAGGESIGNSPDDSDSINCTQQLLSKGRGKKVKVLMLNQ